MGIEIKAGDGKDGGTGGNVSDVSLSNIQNDESVTNNRREETHQTQMSGAAKAGWTVGGVVSVIGGAVGWYLAHPEFRNFVRGIVGMEPTD